MEQPATSIIWRMPRFQELCALTQASHYCSLLPNGSVSASSDSCERGSWHAGMAGQLLDGLLQLRNAKEDSIVGKLQINSAKSCPAASASWPCSSKAQAGLHAR